MKTTNSLGKKTFRPDFVGIAQSRSIARRFALTLGLGLLAGITFAASPAARAGGPPNLKWLGGGQAASTTVAVSPDGNYVATASAVADETIKLWQRSDGRLIRTFAADLGNINGIAFSPDGQLLASANETVSGYQDGAIKVWNVSTGAVVRRLAFNALGEAVAFSPDGQYLAAAVYRDVIVYRLSDGATVHTLTGHSQLLTSVAFSPDGTMLASASHDETIKLWQLSTGTLLRTLTGHTDFVESVAFSPNGQMLASSSWDRTARLWRVSDGTLLQTLTGHTEFVESVAFSPAGDLLASAATDSTVKLWQTSNGSLVRTITDPEGGSLYGVAYLPNGQSLVTATIGGHAKVFQVSNGAVLQSFGHHTAGVKSAAFSRDNQFFASGATDKLVKLWRVSDGMELRTLVGHQDLVGGISFSPDGQIVATASGAPFPDTRDSSIRLWRISDGTQLQQFPGHGNGTFSIDYSPDGQTLVSGGGDDLVKIWRTSDGALLRTLSGHGFSVQSVAYSPDGTLIASGAEDIRIWRASDGVLLRILPNQNTETLAFSPDGATLAAGVDSSGNNLKFWRVADGTLLRTIDANPGSYVQSVAFARDGQSVLTGSGYSFQIRRWRVTDGALLADYDQETGWGDFPSLPIAFSPDGALFGYGRADATVAVAYNSLAPVPVSIASRKTHGSAGAFDIDLKSPAPGIECRSGGPTGDHTVVLSFPVPVSVSGNGSVRAQVTSGVGEVGTGGVADGNAVTVNGDSVSVSLTNVANAQSLTLTVLGVSNGTNTGDVIVSMNLLLGDTTGNGAVNSSDVAQAKANVGATLSQTNFRSDVTVNGSINGSDVGAVKAAIGGGAALPSRSR